jgi:hypothetical protein
MKHNSKRILEFRVFILIIPLILALCASSTFAESLVIAKTEKHYKLINSIFTESKPALFESFNLREIAGKWFFLTETTETELITVKVSDEVVVLQQPVTFSGFRNFVVFLKSHKFSIAEMAYSMIPEISLMDSGHKENISVWYGSFRIQ